jgi:glucose-1-phosphate cytidylyltransferase
VAEQLSTVILCGGRGTRAYPLTADLPKPLLRIAGTPIVEHVMGIYARRGQTRFVLALGYRGELIVEHCRTRRLPWDIEFVDTGLDTPTGARLRRCAAGAGPTFFATYADGLANIDLDALLARHRAHGGPATVTTVPLPSQYGTLDLDPTERVRGFTEKPRLTDHWINAGFFVFHASVFADPHRGDDLEREILPNLAGAGDLHAHRHTGFWRSLDTFKDLQELETLGGGDGLPWW